MSDTTNTANKSRSHVDTKGRECEGQKGFWARFGTVWPHSDDNGFHVWTHANGKHFNVQIECVPLEGRITLRFADECNEH